MGVSTSKRSSPSEKDYRALIEKIKHLQKEINEMMQMKEKESEDYEREEILFEFKKEEWKKERKRLKEEVKRLRKNLGEKEERIREMEEWELMGNRFLVVQMRDEAVERWKQLYLDIKIELDGLIQTTNGGAGNYWRLEDEEMMKLLNKELKSKEETIEALKAKLATMEQEELKSKREIDILRQSLRIMSNKRKAKGLTTILLTCLFVRQRKTKKL